MQISSTDYRPMCQLSQVVILCFYQRPLLATSEIYNTRWMEAHWKEAKLLKLLGVKEANQHKRLDSCFGSLLIPPMTLYLLLYMLMFFNLEHLGTEWETTWTAMDHHLIRLAVMLSKRLLHSSRDRFPTGLPHLFLPFETPFACFWMEFSFLAGFGIVPWGLSKASGLSIHSTWLGS